MSKSKDLTRRQVLATGAALGVAGLSVTGMAAANPGHGDENGKAKQFGRVYANDKLWRTNVVRVLDERPEPEDKIYILHDGRLFHTVAIAIADARCVHTTWQSAHRFGLRQGQTLLSGWS